MGGACVEAGEEAVEVVWYRALLLLIHLLLLLFPQLACCCGRTSPQEHLGTANLSLDGPAMGWDASTALLNDELDALRHVDRSMLLDMLV